MGSEFKDNEVEKSKIIERVIVGESKLAYEKSLIEKEQREKEDALIEKSIVSDSDKGNVFNELEEVALMLKQVEIENEIKRKRRKITPLKILAIIFFPITLLYFLFKKIQKAVQVPLVTKMVIYFTLAFSFILIGFTLFINMTIEKKFESGALSSTFLSQLKGTSIALIIIAIVVFAGLVAITSSLLLNPIRKITKGIDKITSENLSERLEVADTQDELMELTKRINNMLQDIEMTFARQENFVADASHELKTPISVISGYTNLLRRWGTSDPDMVAEAIGAINRECIYMTKIVEQMLLLAKIGKIMTQNSLFDINDVLTEMIDGYKLVKNTHNLTYKGQKGIILKTDKNMIVELVRSIVDNAYKYTPEGGTIKVTANMAGQALRISISDNGCGINANDLPHIFDRFYRCDKVRERQTGSSGLGLTIAKSIVDNLGGRISVKSKVGKGTSFTIDIE